MLSAGRNADVVVLVMDLRLAKECLIAAHDVLSADNERREFVLFQIQLMDAVSGVFFEI